MFSHLNAKFQKIQKKLKHELISSSAFNQTKTK